MRFFEIPGLTDPLELSSLITAASALIGGPVVGWVVQRFTLASLRRRKGFAVWVGRDVLARGLRSLVIAGTTLAGAFIAIAAIPLHAGTRHWLEAVFFAVLIVVFTFITTNVATDVVKLLSRRSTETRRSSSLFANVTRFVIWMLGLLFLLQSLGVSITPILTALGVGGLALALALQDTLSNLFAGMQIIATKKVKRGDYVRLESGQEGYVEDIDWRHTSVRQLPNNMVLVPNASLVNSVVTNFHYPGTEMSVLVEIGVDYASDLEEVERVTIDVAKQTLREVPGGVAEFEPFIRFHTYNDSSIDFTVILRVREFTDQYLVTHEFLKRLHRRYGEEGIVIPFPVRRVEWPGASTQPAPTAPRH